MEKYPKGFELAALSSLDQSGIKRSAMIYPQYPQYRLPRLPLLRLVWSGLLNHTRSFKTDSEQYLKGLSRLEVHGQPALDKASDHGLLLTYNHYSRPGWSTWWLGFALASVLPEDFHLVVTDTHTFRESKLRALLQEPLSRFYLGRVAKVYNFLTMPPMPPREKDTAARTQAVRRLVRFVQKNPNPLVGFSPEGGDSPDGRLSQPPPGVGRLLFHLARLGMLFQPVAIYEDDWALQVHFGEAYDLHKQLAASDSQHDDVVSRVVMRAIAACLPERFWTNTIHPE